MKNGHGEPSFESALRAFFSLRLCFALLTASSCVPGWPPNTGTCVTQHHNVQQHSTPALFTIITVSS